MRFFLKYMLLSSILFSQALAQNLYPDFKIIETTDTYLVADWQPQEIQLKKIHTNNGDFILPEFDFGVLLAQPGQPALPWRRCTIGLPRGSQTTVQIISISTKTYNDMFIAPAPHVFKDKKGLSVAVYRPDEDVYQSGAAIPAQRLRWSEPAQFRDMPIRYLYLSPYRYNARSRELQVVERMRIKIIYSDHPAVQHNFVLRGKLDKLYAKMLLNFDQAKNWQLPRPARLAKAAMLPEGIWYRATVTKDGWYKITPSLLQSAGIDVSALSTSALQMFNNGGHELSIKVNDSWYNPPFTSEIPILIFDQNQNGLFDGNDYLLFYGKHVNGWFYNPSTRDFSYQMHTYATANQYCLTVSGSNGLRVNEGSLSPQVNPLSASYFTDRFHFEKEQYNLLSSGPDWYGYRFYGFSGSHTINFNLPFSNVTGADALFRIRLKGGSHIIYGDDRSYTYKFKVALNNTFIYSNYSQFYFSNGTRILKEKRLTDLSVLKNGQNTLNLQYLGDDEGCAAYIDWFEVYFPREFIASDDQLLFYTKDYSQPGRYTVKNLSDKNDYYIADVTVPNNPVILAKNLSAANGQLTFDLPAAEHSQAIHVFSLSSSAIQSVDRLTPVQRSADLLTTSNQADYLIITHKTFVPWAKEMAALRPNLTSKIVTMQEIYMNFNSGVPDPTALRNFIRYAYYNWQSPSPSYILLFGDAHYDYRNINLPDTMRVPTMEIYDSSEINSRATDNYFVDLNYTGSSSFITINPDLAIGRIPIESTLDAERYIQKIKDYERHSSNDGWQTVLTLVGDDQYSTDSNREWMHQDQIEDIAQLSQLQKFIEKKIYLSMYPSQPGGFDRIKPKANEDLIDALNQGTLIVNFVGHGSPTQWTHEAIFVMDRDLERIVNKGKLPFLIAATCDFGKFDDPLEPSFTEALIWKEESGIIAALASSRLVFSSANAAFNTAFLIDLFPGGAPSASLGEAKLMSTGSSVNDQKFFLFADPTMHLIDPRQTALFTSITPDTLKALSEATVEGDILINGQPVPGFNGIATLLVNDASFTSVKTGGGFAPITLPGPSIFKGEVSVINGHFKGSFIIPKSIRYVNKKTGRITVYAYDETSATSALGYNNQLLITGSASNQNDRQGPQVDIFFQGQENFNSGDLLESNPVLMADVSDENGINITGETGHTIQLQIDQQAPKNISGFFSYKKDSHTSGEIQYPMGALSTGTHVLKLSAFDNLNNPAEAEVEVEITGSKQLVLEQVVNYPNPFSSNTSFTFQTNHDGADVTIKIYTLSGRLIQELNGLSAKGYNDQFNWNGRDRDGDLIANGVYIYKIILKDGSETAEHIDKLVIVR